MLLRQHLGLGLAKAHRAALAAALHAVHEIDPDANQQQKGQQRHDECLEPRLLLAFRLDRNTLVDQSLRDFGILGSDRGVIGPVRGPVAHHLAIQRHLTDRSRVNRRDEFGIRHGPALERVSGTTEQVEQRQDQQEQHQPEGYISCVAQGFSPKNSIVLHLSQEPPI